LQLAKALKDLPLRIQTASKKGRVETIENVEAVLSHPGITESIIRGICKTILLTIPRYNDSPSRSLVRRLVAGLAVNHPLETFKHLVPALQEYALKHKKISPG